MYELYPTDFRYSAEKRPFTMKKVEYVDGKNLVRNRTAKYFSAPWEHGAGEAEIPILYTLLKKKDKRIWGAVALHLAEIRAMRKSRPTSIVELSTGWKIEYAVIDNFDVRKGLIALTRTAMFR